MTHKKLEERKKELMKPGFTEDFQYALQELRPEDAKQIVESMTAHEIYGKVNNRKMQADYICDYLTYLWEISETAFWKHVIITLDLQKGILWSDYMIHIKKMCNTKISDDVLKAVLDFAIGVEVKENYTQDYEAIGCVVKAQVEKFDRIEDINKYITHLSANIQAKAKNKLTEMIKCECNYQFP